MLASQYRHITSGDYEAAYDLFDDGSRELVSLGEYSAFFESASPYEIANYSFPSVRVQRDEASVVADLAVSSSDGEESYEVTQELVREDGNWRVVMRNEQVASFAAAGGTSGGSSASASASAPAEPPASGRDYDEAVTVSRVVDGDTIEVSPAIDSITDVRLIDIDTPETVDPSGEIEPCGPEASDFAIEELTGESVELQFGTEKTDQYDRLLTYVYVGEEMFNEVLVEEGYAQAYPYEPNTEYEDRFATAQDEAKASGLGIWGLSIADQCLLANHGNGIGEGSPGCGDATASPEPTSSAPHPPPRIWIARTSAAKRRHSLPSTRTRATPRGWTRRATAKPAKPPRSAARALAQAHWPTHRLPPPRALRPRRPMVVAGDRPVAATYTATRWTGRSRLRPVIPTAWTATGTAWLASSSGARSQWTREVGRACPRAGSCAAW